jgi:3-deoxy-7-phosphoheptulonate synthase
MGFPLKTKRVLLGNQTIGDGSFMVIAGPCSIESPEQFRQTVTGIKKHGVSLVRGGIFKLRTDPRSFQGLGEDAFQWIRQICKDLGVSLLSEVIDPRQVGEMAELVDVFQVGTRNMYNYALLKELGKSKKPVVLKRAFSALVEEWVLASEYISREGNDQVVLCERGVRSFDKVTRNMLDLGAVAWLKARTEFPVIVDPSHGTGVADLVKPMALASAAVGADGLLVEVHPNPKLALSDSFQAIDLGTFDSLMGDLKKLLECQGRKLSGL